MSNTYCAVLSCLLVFPCLSAEKSQRSLYTIYCFIEGKASYLDEDERDGGSDPFAEYQKTKTIGSRQDAYRRQMYNQILSPERADPFADATPAPDLRTYGLAS